MGAWGVGNLDNDSALDFLEEFEEAEDRTVCLSNILNEVVGAGDCIDADVGSQGLAAGELIAASRGKPNPKLSDEAKASVSNLNVDDALMSMAQKAATMIKAEKSELSELWEESDDYAQWMQTVDELMERLKS